MPASSPPEGRPPVALGSRAEASTPASDFHVPFRYFYPATDTDGRADRLIRRVEEDHVMTEATGAVTAAAITGTFALVTIALSGLAAYVTTRMTTRASATVARTERRGHYRGEFARRQIEASEVFWELSGPTSFTEGLKRIIRNPRSAEPELDEAEADEFVTRFS